MKYSAAFVLLASGRLALSALLNWDVTWVTAAPDGFSRPVIGINGQWPPPVIDVAVGELVQIILTNKLGNETTSLHFHGLAQRRTNTMDGPTCVTQCPIPPGSTFTYTFNADKAGTYWYHSHNNGQYVDGLRGPLIVRDKNPPYAGLVAKEYVMTVSDWYHDQAPNLIHAYQSTANTNGSEPVPWSGLINDKTTDTFPVELGKTYLFRILNMGAFPSFFVGFQGHTMTIVEMDGVYTLATPAKTLYVGAAQRYAVLVTAAADPTKNYGIISAFDTTMFKQPSPNPQFSNASFATLSYKASAGPAAPFSPVFPPIDDTSVLPLDVQPLMGPVTKQFQVNFNFTQIDGIQRAVINNLSYYQQKVPTLYTALSVGKKYAVNPKVYGQVNPMVVQYGDVVEIVINNYDINGHPWHLHGRGFQVVARSAANVLPGAPYASSKASLVPMRRDVAGVRPGGYLAIRFRADNPGIQLLHCHIEWHTEAGLTATIVEAPEMLYGGVAPDGTKFDRLIIPPDHIATCRAGGFATSGNAAGNTKDVLDLTGSVTSPTDGYGALFTQPTVSSRDLSTYVNGLLATVKAMVKKNVIERDAVAPGMQIPRRGRFAPAPM